jgi:hypothetical protein
MTGYRYHEQSEPPEATPVTDVAITRFEHVYEVDPRLMVEHVTQQTFPNWDTLRIVHSRHDHLQWMHDHWAYGVISGAEVLAQLEAEDGSAESDGTAPGRPG